MNWLERIMLDTQVQLRLLEEYLDLMERSLPMLVAVKREQQVALEKLFATKPGPEAEIEGRTADKAALHADYMEAHAFPKIVWGSFVVTLWTFFETQVKQYASLDQPASEGVELSDFKGDLLKKYRKYVLVGTLLPLLEYDKLELIQHVRNAIVHADGRLTKEDKVHLKRLCARLAGFNLGPQDLWQDDYLILEGSFGRWACNVVSDEVTKLVEAFRVRLSFPGMK